MKRILLALMIIALIVAVGCAKQVTEKPAAEKADSVAEVEAGTAALDEMEQDLNPDDVEGLDDINTLFEDY